MSVRRLADESIQPAAFAFSSENLAWAHKKIAEYRDHPVLFTDVNNEKWRALSRAK